MFSPSGRGVPPKPGWTGTMTRAGPASARRSAKPVTDCGRHRRAAAGTYARLRGRCRRPAPGRRRRWRQYRVVVADAGGHGRDGGVAAHHARGSLGGHGLSGRDHVVHVAEVLHVQVRRERVEQDGRLVAHVGERVRRARRDHHQRPGRGVIGRFPDREAGRARDDVEALVVLAVPVLLRAVGVRGDGDLAQAQAVRCRAAVLQDPHLNRPGQGDLAVAGADDRDLGHVCLPSLRKSSSHEESRH